MVVSEIVAATMIAVCGLKKSYRIVLRGERMVRQRIRRPQPMISGRETMPRRFIRHVFKAGHHIAVRWEGRAQNAAQRARTARLRALEARDKVADVSADVRARAGDARDKVADVSADMRARAEDVRARAGAVRERARDSAARVQTQVRAAQERAAAAKKQLDEARERLAAARDTAADVARRASAAAIRVRDSLPAVMRYGGKPSRGIADVLEDGMQGKDEKDGKDEKAVEGEEASSDSNTARAVAPEQLDAEKDIGGHKLGSSGESSNSSTVANEKLTEDEDAGGQERGGPSGSNARGTFAQEQVTEEESVDGSRSERTQQQKLH